MFVSLLFAPLKMSPVKTKSTWEAYGIFLNSFHPKWHWWRLEQNKDKTSRHKVPVQFNPTHTHTHTIIALTCGMMTVMLLLTWQILFKLLTGSIGSVIRIVFLWNFMCCFDKRIVPHTLPYNTQGVVNYVMVIVIRNGHSNTSLNPEQDCLHFTYH